MLTNNERRYRNQSRYDQFRDNLGDAVAFKMKANGRKFRELSAELDTSPSALSQIRQGSAGTERAVPKLEIHFRVLNWLDAPIAQFEKDVRGTRAESTINDVWDVISRLKIPAKARNQMAEVITVLWENQV